MTLNENIFIEQAEYIEEDEFNSWTISHPEESSILRKLSQGGAKVISGPRGSGKTTLFRMAYFKMLREKKLSLPVYVNFKTSLKLEPFYKNKSNATYIFIQWMLLKIIAGIYETISQGELRKANFNILSDLEVNNLIGELEIGKYASVEKPDYQITIRKLVKNLNSLAEENDYSRCVLLLDDAAHAFSTEQQRDFFSFFRELKSKTIAPKAAIYPGVTTFSADFNIGHDAEEIDIWLRPDNENYLVFMRDILRKRLPTEVFNKLDEREDLINLLIYSSFGLPRSLLNMVRSLYKSDDLGVFKVENSFKRAFQEIKVCFEVTFSVYSSLEQKLPIFKKFVESGKDLYEKMLSILKDYNKKRSANNLSQSMKIAVVRPVPAELDRVFGFFQYTGLLMPRGQVNRGAKGVYDLYEIHYAALIERNALHGGKVRVASEIVKEFKTKPKAHLYPRFTPENIISTAEMVDKFSLSLPPCQVCNSPRLSESARFCSSCGTKLKSVSVFESLINQDISNLPLTDRRVRNIKKHSNIRIIKDILLDFGHDELRGVPQIGPFWSKKIFGYAEEYIS